MSGAAEAGAVQVIPAATDLLEYLASYAARLPPGPLSYYINDRYLMTVPEELVESLLELYSNATSPGYVLVFGNAPASVAGRDNSDTAFGYRDTWYIWVWPFWLRTPGGAAVDGNTHSHTVLPCVIQSLLTGRWLVSLMAEWYCCVAHAVQLLLRPKSC